jgi:hypothetical protein
LAGWLLFAEYDRPPDSGVDHRGGAMAPVEVIPTAPLVAADPDGRWTGQQLGQRFALQLRQIRCGGQVIGTAGVRVARPRTSAAVIGSPGSLWA